MIVARLALGAAAAWAAYAWGAHLFASGWVSRGPGTERRIALTFDDGPDPVWTERILGVLEQEQARASFFLVGERAVRAPETVRRKRHALGRVGDALGVVQSTMAPGWAWSRTCSTWRTDGVARKPSGSQRLRCDHRGCRSRGLRPRSGASS